MRRALLHALGAVAVLLTTACTQASSALPGSKGSPAETPAIDRTLVIGVGRGPASLASKPIRQIGGPAAPTTSVRAFNAGLVLLDGHAVPLAGHSWNLDAWYWTS